MSDSVTDLSSAASAFMKLDEAPVEQPAEAPKAEAEQKSIPQQEPAQAAEELKTAQEEQDKAAEQDEGEEQIEEDEQQSAEAQDEPSIDLAALAKALGIDAEQLSMGEGGVQVLVDMGGQSEAVPLAKLRETFQAEKALVKKSTELAEMRQAFEAEQQQLRERYGQDLQYATALSHHLEAELVQEFQAVNWNELRQNDPAEYAAAQHDFNTKLQRIQGLKQGLAQHQQQYQAEQVRQQQEQLARIMEKEQETLFTKIPQWRDKAVAKAEVSKIQEFLASNGFSDAEIGGLYDHRAVLLARDAMQYRDMMAKAAAAKKKVKDLPKVLTPGTTKSSADLKSEKQQQQMGKLKKTGSVHDAAQVFLQRMK